MRLWVLGTLEISGDGAAGGIAVDLRGAALRRLISLLALEPGVELSTDRLVDEMWPMGAPAAAQATLQSHVARLRRALPDADAVRTGHGGYRLAIDPWGIDAVRFERGVEQGATLLRQGRHLDASRLLTETLELWRGLPFAEFTDTPRFSAESARLDALRLDALEIRIAAELGRSGAAPPIAELEALVRWHPLRESFWALLMSALYRAGRQADALAAYQRARTTLDDELGISPGPALREMERRVLEQDPTLDGSSVLALLPVGDARPYASEVVLVERESHMETLTAALDETVRGTGRLVLVHGEAGAGKSALAREFCAAHAASARILRGACDPLSSPRPLGPLADMASHLGESVVERLGTDDPRDLFEQTLAALSGIGPSVMVVEDLHWADESTLDWLRFLVRRIDTVPCLLVATFRDEQQQVSSPLRVFLGDIASIPVVRRLAVPPLSLEGVAALARGVDVDLGALFTETGGNAFFVTEVIAAGGDHLPASVQDAVLARMDRLSPQARSALEAAAVIGTRMEPRLLHGMPGVGAESVDEGVAAGMLVYDPPSYAFRHELVRQVVLSGITPGRLGALHWQVLERLRTLPIHPRPLARLAEHSEASGDPSATLEFATAAGDQAARLGSHREAAVQYGRAAVFADLLDADARITLLFNWARECDWSDRLRDSIAASERLVDLLRAQSRETELARSLLQLERTYANIGNAARSEELWAEAIGLLEGGEPGPELALAYAYRSGTLMVADRFAEGEDWARRALELADACGAEDAAIYALNTLGICRGFLGDRTGELSLRESLTRAQAAGQEYEAGRAYTNLACLLEHLGLRDEAMAVIEDGMAYAEEHDVHGALLCMMADHVRMCLERGDWDRARQEAENLLYVRMTERLSRAQPLTVLALVAARRGDLDNVWHLLDEVRGHLAHVGQIQYEAPFAIACAEVHVLDGDPAAAVAVLSGPYEEALRLGSADHASELALWLWRCGALPDVPELIEGPARLAVTGRHREAAEAWDDEGRVYAAAWGRLDGDDEGELRRAREAFAQLGARVLVERTDDRLRSLGARVPRGARPATRRNVGGLTDRELDVLDLLDEGLRNADIAERLHLSSKTVGNHVSAILAKLGASSRLEAVRRARDLSAVG
jgi:DNA-binding SARP family transcriptional activator/DNA-binding CsgD family transcriptional regulator/tetratricopeptide (TPR) repeat protein